MQVTKINNSYSATGQINVSDLDEIFADGFKTIVCFRPEEEDAEHQPKQKTLQEAAAQKGMTFLSIPIIPGNITPDHVSQFRDLMHTVNSLFSVTAKAEEEPKAYTKHMNNHFISKHNKMFPALVTGRCV